MRAPVLAAAGPVLISGVLLLAGCGGGAQPASPAPSAVAPAESGTLTVLAAASLT